MAVHIHIGQRAGEDHPQSSKRADKLSLTDRRTIALAPEIIARQKAGYVTSRQLCECLKADGVLQPSGKAWAESTLFRMLKRGRKLGFPFVLRSRSQAASDRPPDHRTPATKRAERNAALQRLLEFAQSKVAENDSLSISGSSKDHCSKFSEISAS